MLKLDLKLEYFVLCNLHAYFVPSAVRLCLLYIHLCCTPTSAVHPLPLYIHLCCTFTPMQVNMRNVIEVREALLCAGTDLRRPMNFTEQVGQTR